MLHIAIAEDESSFAQQLEKNLERFGQDNHIELKPVIFSDGASLVEHFTSEWDLLLLDVEMPGMDGISAARCIRERDPEVPIMFITNLAQYAIRGYEVDALDYVLKPVSYYSLAMKLKKALRLIRRKDNRSILLNREGDVVRLPLSHLYYVEVFGHQLHYHTSEGEFTQTGSRSLAALEKELSGCGFARCHSGYLVNLRYVDAVEADAVRVTGRLLPVSRSRRGDFLQALLDDTKGEHQP